jgi:acetyl-CoA carboxylase alpha subunit
MALALAAFTIVMMMVFLAVPSGIGVVGEGLEGGAAISSQVHRHRG